MRAVEVPVDNPADPRLTDYTGLTDVALRTRREPAEGLYIAESSTVLGRALAAGHRPRSVLCAPRWLPDVHRMLADAPGGGAAPGVAAGGGTSGAGVAGSGDDVASADAEPVPVYVAETPVLEAITGFHVHRGALAAMHRPALRDPRELLATARDGGPARRVAVFEDLVDHTNLGAGLRSAAALGVDAVLVTPQCADPLYRRAVRVSMGTVFQVPWTRVDPWPEGIALLREAGFTVAALALREDAITLDELAADPPERLALVLGAEGDGLSARTVADADVVVRIPMAGGVDSLNVAAASAVAFWATRVR